MRVSPLFPHNGNDGLRYLRDCVRLSPLSERSDYNGEERLQVRRWHARIAAIECAPRHDAAAGCGTTCKATRFARRPDDGRASRGGSRRHCPRRGALDLCTMRRQHAARSAYATRSAR